MLWNFSLHTMKSADNALLQMHKIYATFCGPAHAQRLSTFFATAFFCNHQTSLQQGAENHLQSCPIIVCSR